MQVEFEEAERQAILLALARLAVDRPGWDLMLGEIADKLNPLLGEGTFRVDEEIVVLRDTRRSGRETYEALKLLMPLAPKST